jgi:hypothetical protein
MAFGEGHCGVAAVGRCSRCGRAACFSHLADGRGRCQECVNKEYAAYVKRNTEQAAPHVKAVSEATARRLAAVQALTDLGTPGLVARRIRVGYDPKRFGRDVSHHDVYEAAWPVGDCVWQYSGTGYASGEKLSFPSGVTSRNQLVSMLHPSAGELAVDRADPRVRLSPGSVRPVEQTAATHEMIADALEKLVSAHGR